MNTSFMTMYGFIRDLNNKLSESNFNTAEMSEEFFRDLEKVFEEIADVVSNCPLFESTKKEND